ncbi:MAG TPA: hypothetical protein PKD09_01915 [Aggregatilinea sp.]|uniref:hypothetical protein n=1 Tax=Aggregatilinea sp. TaxID=2806333 RepID=UPI002B586AEA|nr:hypothetical protein [Aggregatilinea sp.]HML20373.1 hypothetical protein [Aggregatilinea sp.]
MWHSIQDHMSWRAIPIAGLAAGTVFLLVIMILTPVVMDVEPTIILRYFGSLVLGTDILLKDDILTLVVGIIVHYALSIAFTVLIAVVIHRWGLLVGIIGGGIMGIAIYLLNLYFFTVLFEWFFAINSSVLLLSHILFGATAGGVYELFDQYDTRFELEVE